MLSIELFGTLPKEFQLITTMTAAVPMTAREPEAAKAFIKYLQTPAAGGGDEAVGVGSYTQGVSCSRIVGVHHGPAVFGFALENLIQ